jgi:hypothetical protein
MYTMWILAGVFAMTGAPMVWLALRTFAKDREMATWPRVPGVITSTRLDSWMETSKDKNGFTSRSTRYKPVVHYRYTVGGQTLEGTIIDRHGAGSQDKKAAQGVLDAYPAEQAVMVLHDPADPTTAYLRTTRSVGGIILCCFGSFWLATGLLLFGLSFL